MNIFCCFTCRKRPKAQSVHPPPINSPNNIQSSIFNKQKTLTFSPPKKRMLLSVNHNTPSTPSNQNKKKNLYPLKDQFRCLFCGGKNCPHEDYRKHKNPAIKGLNSDLIDGIIFASQRPSNLLIKKYDIINSFKEKNISLIINLQRPGEHPYCGPNELDPFSGFAYNPSFFSSEGIKVKLSGWKDMDVPDSLYFMLDIIKEMTYTITQEKKRVLVHCHAGYGRTGVVLACYKIYNENIPADEAVRRIRVARPKCIEQKSQMKYCIKFYQFVTRLREIFTPEKMDINLFLKHQCDIAGYEERNNTSIVYVPKLISATFIHLIEMKKFNSNMHILKAMNGGDGLSDEKFANICTIVEDINNNKWNTFKEVDDITVIAELLYIWLDECVNYCIYPLTIIKLFNIKHLIAEQEENDLAYFILNCREIKMSSLNVFLTYVRKTLKKYEYEIILYCAMFLKEIYPTEQNYKDEIEDYEHMCEKIAIYLLGYNIDIVYENELNIKDENDNSHNVIFDSIQKMIILMDFLRCNIHSSLSEDMNYNNLNEEVRVQLNTTKITQIRRNFGSFSSNFLNLNVNHNNNNNKVNNIHHHNNNNNNNGNNNNDVSNTSGMLSDLKINSTNEHNNPKERSLFEIYQILKKHFNTKDNIENQNGAFSPVNRHHRHNNNNNNNNETNNHDNSNMNMINESKQNIIDNNNDDINIQKLIINDNSTPNTVSKNMSTNDNINNSKQNANSIQTPIIQVHLHKDKEDVYEHKKTEFDNKSEVSSAYPPQIECKKKRKEFLSCIPKLGKKRSPLSLKYKYSLRLKVQNVNTSNNQIHNSCCYSIKGVNTTSNKGSSFVSEN